MSQTVGGARRPSERYGDPTPRQALRRRRLGLAGAAALLATGVGFALWVGVSSSDDVTVAPLGYEHTGDGVLSVTFTVTRPASSALVCQVEALSSGQAQVGLASVDVPPSAEPVVVVTAEVRTSERAVTGRAVGCEPA